MANLANIAFQLETIYTNPESYIRETVEIDKKDEDINRQFINILSKVNKIDDILVTVLKSTLDVLFTHANIKVSYDNLKEYLIFMQSRTGKTLCTKFVSQAELIDSFDDGGIYPVEVLFKAQSCASCGFFQESHNACSKYIVDNPEPFDSRNCECCGRDKYSHIVCDTFIGTNNKMCDNCGRDLFTHQQYAKEHGNFNCTHFQKTKDESIFDCENCIFSETDHYLNPNLFNMNKEAYRKFTDLAIKFQTEFIKQGSYGIIQNKELFSKIIKMNYTSIHPMFSKYDFVKTVITQV